MKALIVSLLFPILLKSCEGIPDQTGRPPDSPPANNGSGSGSGTGGTGASGSTSAPIDGGISILLIAGVAYGAKRYRDNRNKEK